MFVAEQVLLLLVISLTAKFLQLVLAWDAKILNPLTDFKLIVMTHALGHQPKDDSVVNRMTW